MRVAASCPAENWVPVGAGGSRTSAPRPAARPALAVRDDLEIARIRVIGVEPALAATLTAALHARVGQRFAEAPIEADLAALATLGVLASVAAEIEPATATLTYAVAPAPIIGRVYGIAPDTEHLGRLDYLAGSPYDAQRVQRIAAAIERAYVRDGHLDARISVATSPATHDLCVRAIPGPRVTLDAVRFPGASHVPEAALLAHLRTAGATDRTNHVGGVYAPELLDLDRLRLAADELWERGMALGTVGEPRLERHGAHHATLVIPVDEGPVFTIGAIAVPPLFPPPPGLERGDRFARSHVEAAQGALQELVGDRGTVAIATAVHADRAQIDLTFSIAWRSPWDAVAYYWSH